MRYENRFTRQHSFTGTEQLAHDSLAGIRAVAHLGFECYSIVHIIHCSGFGDYRLAWIQLDFDNLHIITKNLVINFMTLHSHPFLFVKSFVKFMP
jgi:hypothetical protein